MNSVQRPPRASLRPSTTQVSCCFSPTAFSARAVETKLDVSRPTIAKWRRRFLEHGVEGLTNRHRGRRPWKSTARLRARVLAATRRRPPDGSTHWSCRRALAAHLGVTKDIVQRIWQNVRTGEVQGKTTARHTSRDFVGFLGEVVATRAPDEEIHVILDNLSTHKTKLVEAFLDEHPNVTLHFTPTYSSWLNQVELWFSKVQRDVLSRGIFTSTADLARKLRRYIDAYAKRARPFRWKYANPAQRITHGELSSATVH